MDRRTLFREYMRRFDPTADPDLAVKSGFYIPPPNAVSHRIATRIELEPASNHLLVGGIGSGKTTELIAIEQRLALVEDLLPVRVDVPSRHRMDKLKPGVLIALAATEASKQVEHLRGTGLVIDEEGEKALHVISAKSTGYFEDIRNEEPPEEDHVYWVPGILQEPEMVELVTALADSLRVLHGILPRKLVMLFDGLDRVGDLEVLASVFRQDVPALAKTGVGLVIIGPQRLRFSSQSAAEGSFESVHLHGAVGTDSSLGRQFLVGVLRKRAEPAILPDDAALALARWSGGVLRDLIALARAAGAEAYADGSDTVTTDHVNVAADRFGRDLLLGTTKEMLLRLKDLFPRRPLRPGAPVGPAGASFAITTEVEQRLLMDRLIIEVPDVPIRYIPHPAIVPLIPGLG